jgi:uncharacterized membrane protein YqgA involved in biofilm formation
MLQNTSSIVAIIAQIVAVIALIAGPLFGLWMRVKAVEMRIEQHGQKLQEMSTVIERLTRIETLLEMLVKEHR